MEVTEVQTASSNSKSVSDSNTEEVIDDNVIDNCINTKIANILGYDIPEENVYSLIFGEELSEYGIVLKSSSNVEELQKYNDSLTSVKSVVLEESKVVDITRNEKSLIEQERLEREAEETAKLEYHTLEEEKTNRIKVRTTEYVPTITYVDQSEALLETESPDENYTGCIVELTAEDRDLLERLVMGEAGGEGIEGAALVAQAIRDTMVYRGFNSVEDVRKALKYSGSTKKEPNQDVLDAVSYIFDEGGIAVKHSIFYFYAHKKITSKFHESQKFIIEYGGHRFFSTN